MRLKVELFSTFQRKARRRTAHQCHTRPRQVAHAAPLPRRRAKQPGDPANVLPAALCQGVFEASAVLKTRLVCFSPYAPGHMDCVHGVYEVNGTQRFYQADIQPKYDVMEYLYLYF